MSSPQSPPNLRELSTLKLALLAGQARERSGAALRAEPIAIIGMGCRLPGGADDPEAFWQLLVDGVDAVREIPAGRWDAAALYDPDPSAPGRIATRWAGFLEDIAGFDAAFFGILPREAERMDPQQRLFLEVAVEALDHAGLPRDRLAGSRTGAFVASYYNEYAQLQYADPASIDARTLTGTVHSVLVNRLSYLFDLRGPSISVDTACSSSLVAIHLACESLRHGESDLAIAGGVSLMVSESLMISLSKVGFMSPDGRCRTFDADASGFGRGEGCSVVVLKRLSDALADGDRVLAVVRGSAVNQDGHSTVLAAPNGLAQQDLIREALDNAQVDASSIGYVEAHGTGTPLGDPIEVEALAATVGRPAPGAGPCLLGAAKSSIGHLEAAAGAAGLVKAVQVLRHGLIPAQVNFRRLNPHIRLEGTRLAIATEHTPWPSGSAPRRIGTSGFGVGGTNAHVVIEEAPRLPADVAPTAPAPWLLPLSAQGEDALRALAARWEAFLGTSDATLAALCACAAQRRTHLPHRLALVCRSVDEARGQLRAYVEAGEAAGVASGVKDATRPLQVAFVFSGQGQQWLGMGRELLRDEPVFRDCLADIDARLQARAGWSLLAALDAPEGQSRLDETEVAQPAIFALQVALAALWAHWGVRPQAVVGHSVGEIAALHVAGVLDLDEALRVVVERARCMQRATGQGAMAAIGLDADAASARLAPFGNRLSLGAVNSPRGVVVSGEPSALQEVLGGLDRDGIAQRALPVNYAFHSAQMADHARELAGALGAVRTQPARVPVYSTVTGKRHGGPFDAAYFARNVRETVRFAEAMDALLHDGHRVFVELAAHPVLGAAMAECAEACGRPARLVASLRRGRPERETLLQGAAALHVAGAALAWQAIQGGPATVLDLPRYPWQHHRFWLSPPAGDAGSAIGSRSATPLLGQRLDLAGTTVFQARWPVDDLAWFEDHRVGGQPIVAGMVLLQALHEASAEAFGEPRCLVDFVVHRPLQLDAAGTQWQVSCTTHTDGSASLALHHRNTEASAGWTLIAEARAERPAEAARATTPPPRDPPALDATAFYDAFARLGIEFGPSFRVVHGLSIDSAQSATALLDGGARASHATLLDGALQAAVAALGGGRAAEALLPFSVDRLELGGAAPSRAWARLHWQRPQPGGAATVDIELHDAAGYSVARASGVRLVPAGALAQPASGDDVFVLRWQRKAAVPASATTTDLGLVARADDPRAGPVAAALAAHGHRVRRLSLTEPVVHRAAWEGLLQGLPASSELIWLWQPDEDESGSPAANLLALMQALIARGQPSSLCIATRAAQAVAGSSVDPSAASLWGLAAVAAVEHPEISLTLADLDPDAPDADSAALAELVARAQGPLMRLARRAGAWFEPTLVREDAGAGAGAGASPLALRTGADGTLDGLAWAPTPTAAPGPGEVRLRVQAAGLNFRDVLMALGMIPGQAHFLGAECAGVVEACGAGVSGLAPGDAVFGFAPRSLATQVNVPADFVARWPAELGTIERAASLPVAYLTALLGLRHLAGLRAGQTVLVHAAAGGVGMAALHVARAAGATVYATAGSPARRELVRRLGAEQVFDSRSPDFAARLLDATGGRGVDVVLNSLAGEFIEPSVRSLAPQGCFLELGKREVWSAARFAELRPAARYEVYDLGSVAASEPQRVRTMLGELLAGLRDGTLPALPLRVLPFEDAPTAFRLMAQARHVGKLVLRAPAGGATSAALVRADGRYLVTGGLGAIGLHTARWLASRGAGQILLCGRRAPDAAAAAAIESMRAQGAAIEVAQVDAGDETALRELLRPAADRLPLRGIFHAAGVLDDGPLLQQDATRLARVRRGKALGARVLDRLSRGHPLDLFVLYSAAGHWLGARGQGPYAAANAELDALAQARRAEGLPGLSVGWGLWRDGGMGARLEAAGQRTWSERGLRALEADAAFDRLEHLCRTGTGHALVLPIDWHRFLAQLADGLDAEFFAGLARARRPAAAAAAQAARATARAAAAERLAALPAAQRREQLAELIAAQARQVIGLADDAMLPAELPLKEAGLDSLMAVELRNQLARALGQPLPATLLFDHPSIGALGAELMRRLGWAAAATPPDDPGRRAVAALSDAEAEAQLLAELNGASAPRTADPR